MIGRAARGNPYIFRQVNESLANGKIVEQNNAQKIADFFQYVELAKKFDLLSLNDIKTKAQQFTRTLPDACLLRRKIAAMNDLNKIIEAVKKIKLTDD